MPLLPVAPGWSLPTRLEAMGLLLPCHLYLCTAQALSMLDYFQLYYFSCSVFDLGSWSVGSRGELPSTGTKHCTRKGRGTGSIHACVLMDVMQDRKSKEGQAGGSFESLLPRGKWSWYLGTGYFRRLVNDFEEKGLSPKSTQWPGKKFLSWWGRQVRARWGTELYLEQS